MANVVKIEPGQLGSVIRADARNLKGVIRRGVRRGAQKFRTRVVRTSPVDRGVLKNAWEVQDRPQVGDMLGIEVVNTAPYAGVVERGSRPFKMPRWVIEGPLAEWVKRKIIGSTGLQKRLRYRKAQIPISPAAMQGARQSTWYVDDEARRIAYAIAAKVARVGFRGKFWVKKNLPAASFHATEEVMREITKYFTQGGGATKMTAAERMKAREIGARDRGEARSWYVHWEG